MNVGSCRLLGLAVAAAILAVLPESRSISGAGAAAQALAVPPAVQAFDRQQVVQGAQLAAIGNCAPCHTRAGGKAYAGGRPLQTPFGTIYSTNITPDAETGIGAWSQSDFLRAMHDGVDRSGRNLYPAFPYDHFTRVRDADVNAIYAYMMSRDPVQAVAPANRLVFPMNFRMVLSAWKALFLARGVYRFDPAHSAEWNRGAYLVEGLGHCGACHTPRNVLGAEKKNDDLGGGEAEGWHAMALNIASPAPAPWTAEEMFKYLREGWEASHGTAAGPMAPVVHGLAEVPEEDVRAIATYIVWAMGGRAGEPATRTAFAVPADEGAVIFEGACAACHDAASHSTPSTSTVPLALATSLNAPDPRNVIHVVLDGIWPEAGEKGALMPGFEGALTHDQLVTLLSYLRAHFTDRPPWKDLAAQATRIAQRKE